MSDALQGLPISETAAYRARVYFGVTVPLMVLCLAVTITRIYRRIGGKLDWEDWLVLLGGSLAIVDWSLLITEMVTQPCLLPLPKAINSFKLAFFAIPVWSWAMTSIKVSVALTLLRIRDTIRWRIFLYPIIGLQVAYLVGNTIFIFNVCHPLAAWWDRSIPGSVCVDDASVRIASNIGSAINIATDVLLSLSPIVFLCKLNRPLGERIMLCVLMGLGLLASISSLMKTLAVQDFDSSPGRDAWAIAITIGTWTVLEQGFAVLGACGPFMKPVVERGLNAIGIRLSFHDSESNFGNGPRTTFRIPTITMSTQQDNASNSGNGSEGSKLETEKSTVECPTVVCQPHGKAQPGSSGEQIV